MPDTSATMLMAFDFGTRKIGVAVGQDLTGTATGIASVRTSDSGDHFTAIADLIREWNPRGLVVGLPLDVEGRETGA
ncbi:MAG: Holliday junction resolvase RuvX, partial [Proteobacteria bacterium]